MDKPGDEDQWPILGLLLEALPADDGQVVRVRGPGELVGDLAGLLELHGELTFHNLVLREHLEMAGQTEFLTRGDEPLGRVVLVPLDRVPVIHGELMVEVVVAFADGDERGDDMVAGRVLVVKRRLAKPVRKGVDAERRLEAYIKVSLAIDSSRE